MLSPQTCFLFGVDGMVGRVMGCAKTLAAQWAQPGHAEQPVEVGHPVQLGHEELGGQLVRAA